MKTFIGISAKMMAIFFLALSFAVSCVQKEPDPNDDDVIETPGGGEEQTPTGPDPVADSLSNILQRQVEAMSYLLGEENVTLAYCRPGQAAGQYEMSFDGGSMFTIYPADEQVQEIFSYVEKDGQKVWILKDKNGLAAELKSEAGNSMPLASVPDVTMKDSVYVFVFGDLEFASEFGKEDQVQAFDCAVLSDADGQVYAADFLFGEGKTVRVYVSTYPGASFYLAGDESRTPVKEVCVSWGETVSLGLDMAGGIDYKLEIPEGWQVKVREEGSALYMDVTAPQKGEDAVNQGDVVIMTADGLFTLGTINVTTDPFTTLLASATKVAVVPTAGIEKFAYGISLKGDFDAQALQAKAAAWIAGSEAPSAGSFVATEAVAKTFAEVLGSELNPEAEYVLWAASANNLMSVDFTKITAEITAVKAYMLDADIKVVVNGADAVFGGVALKGESMFEEILFQVNESVNDSIPSAGGKFEYEGTLVDYPAVDGYRNEVEMASTYVVWAVPAVTGEYEYTQEDIFYAEVTTNDLVPGSSLQISLSDLQVTPSTISAPAVCKGAEMICYAFLPSSTGSIYAGAEDADKMAQMKKASMSTFKGDELVITGKKLSPNTSYWLYATAVDKDGKYGPISCVKGTTTTLEFDATITLSVEQINVTAKKAELKVTSKGGDLSEYIYWFGRITDPFWANTSYCGKNKTEGQKYMALNFDDENITKAMKKYGEIGPDGTIVFEGLTMETEYIFMILEKGEKFYSKAGYKKVTTLAADLGTVVVEGSEQWNNARASVTLDWVEGAFKAAANSNMMASYAFDLSVPKNLTAYVMCGSDTYFSEAGFTKVEHIMIEIENYASRRYANGRTPIVNGEHATEPDYVKNGEHKEGQLMNVYEFCVHGVPAMGFVTYFAEGSHGEGNCIYWDKGECQQYKSDMEAIARYNTLAPWQERAEQFGLTGKEADDWAQALLEAYSVYYKDAKPVIYENTGAPLRMSTPYATGKNEEGVIPDRVIVMLKDLDGNYYEPMFFEVPDYFN